MYINLLLRRNVYIFFTFSLPSPGVPPGLMQSSPNMLLDRKSRWENPYNVRGCRYSQSWGARGQTSRGPSNRWHMSTEHPNGNFQKAEVSLSTDYYQGVCSSVPFRDQMQWVAGLLLERPTNPGYLRRKESDPEVKVSVSGFIANLVRLILVYPVEASEIPRVSGRSVSRFHCLKPSRHCLQGSVEDHHILWNLQCHSELW